MVLRGVVGVVLAVVALTGAARESRGQPITVTNNGQALAGAQVSAMINGIKQPLGTTNVDGQVTIDTSALNITKGTQVTVWIKTCEDGQVQVILVPTGEQGECADEGDQAGERCGCRRAGVIFWGGGPVTVDVGTGTAIQVTAGAGSALSGLSVGAALDLRWMTNLEDVVGMVPGGTGASATSWAPGFELLLDWWLFGWLALGVDGSYSTMDTEIRFPEGVQTGDIRYYELGGNVKVGPPKARRFWPYATFGLYRTWNKADFALNGETEYRLHKTRRDGLGAGIDYRPRPNMVLRFEGLYNSTFEDHDADEHIRWKFAFLFLPFWKYVDGERGGQYVQ
jgi:hypothetical protein